MFAAAKLQQFCNPDNPYLYGFFRFSMPNRQKIRQFVRISSQGTEVEGTIKETRRHGVLGEAKRQSRAQGVQDNTCSLDLKQQTYVLQLLVYLSPCLLKINRRIKI